MSDTIAQGIATNIIVEHALAINYPTIVDYVTDYFKEHPDDSEHFSQEDIIDDVDYWIENAVVSVNYE